MDELIHNPALDSQRKNEHPCGNRVDSSAKQLGQESVSPMTYQELLQQYTMLSSRNAELAKEYFKLEQEQIVLEHEHSILKQEYTVSHEREQELQQKLAQSQAMLSGVLSSLSWRVTAPIRKLMEQLRRRK